MYSPTYIQNTAEAIIRSYDFGNLLAEDENISTAAGVAVDQNGNDESTLVTIDSFGSKIVNYKVASGGTNGDILKITLTITTTHSNTRKGYVYVHLSNK